MLTTAKTKKEIGKDFKAVINKEWFIDKAETHIKVWKERYKEYTNKKEVSFDLYVNHDISLEIESAEEFLQRKLSNDEYDKLFDTFNQTVLKIFNKKRIELL